MNTSTNHNQSSRLMLIWALYVITGPLWGAIFIWGFGGLYLGGEISNYFDSYFTFLLMWAYIVGIVPSIIAGTIHVALLVTCRHYKRKHSNIISGVLAGLAVSTILLFWYGFYPLSLYSVDAGIGILPATCIFACLASAILTSQFAKA